MKRFLETRSGLIAGRSIDTISERSSVGPSGHRWVEIEYHVGDSPRETVCTPEQLAAFLEEA